jgi:hypothetical protein
MNRIPNISDAPPPPPPPPRAARAEHRDAVRDAFAMQFAGEVLAGRLGPSWRSRIVFADLAAQAYAYADAMMAARGTGRGQGAATIIRAVREAVWDETPTPHPEAP